MRYSFDREMHGAWRRLVCSSVWLAVAATLPQARGAPPAAAASPVPTQNGPDENWLSAQVRRFRAYPHLHRAHQLLSEKKWEQAARELRLCLEIDPDDLELRIGLLRVLYEQEHWAELLHHADQILARRPDERTALLYSGFAHQRAGRADAALARFEAVYGNARNTNADRILAAGSAADVALAAARPAQALAALTVLGSLQSTYAVDYRRGMALASLHKLDEAEQAYTAAKDRAATRGEQVQVLSALGYLAQQSGNSDRAISYGIAVLALSPRHVDWLRTLSYLYQGKREYAQGETMARRVLDVTNAVQDRLALGNLLMEKGDPAGAIAHFAQAADGASDAQTAYQARMGLGYAYQGAGKQSAAHEAFEQAAGIMATPEALAAADRTAKGAAGKGAPARKSLAGLAEEYRREPGAHTAASIAYLYAQQGNHEWAAFYMEAALRTARQADDTQRWRLFLAEQYAQLGNHDKVEQLLAAVTPGSALDWRRISELHVKLGKPALAAEALSHGADTVETMLQLSQHYAASGQRDKALAALQAVLARHPPNEQQAQAWCLTGYLHVQAGNSVEAAEAFQAALATGDRQGATHKELAFIYMKLAQYPQALEQLLHALLAEPVPRNMLAVARLYAAMKQDEAALQYYRMAADQPASLNADELAALHTEMGTLHAQAAQFDEARQHWLQAATLHGSADLQLQIAYAEEMQGRLDAASARLAAIPRASLGQEQARRLLEQLARLSDKRGDTAQALALEPTALRHYRMGLQAQEQKHHALARMHLSEAVELAPDNVDYLQQLAYVCKAQGDDACAIAQLEQVVGKDPKRVAAFQDLAYTYVHAGDNGKAIAWFKKTIDATNEQGGDGAARTAHALRQQVREMSRRYQLNVYQSYRPNSTVAPGSVPPTFATGSLLPSQGGIELQFQPPGIGYRNGKTLRFYGRALWSAKAESPGIAAETVQGGFGAAYKPVAEANLYLGLERLFKIGSQSQNNWLARASWGYSDGYDMTPNLASWNQTIVYADVAYLLQEERTRSVYAEVRQGHAFSFHQSTTVTPHFTLAGRRQYPDPYDASYLEAGAGAALKFLFNETRYEAARSSGELVLQYRRRVTGPRTGGWVLTVNVQF